MKTFQFIQPTREFYQRAGYDVNYIVKKRLNVEIARKDNEIRFPFSFFKFMEETHGVPIEISREIVPYTVEQYRRDFCIAFKK